MTMMTYLLYISWGISVEARSEVLLNSQFCVIIKKYIPLPIYNSDDVVMSRENQNFHLHLFVKGGALQISAFFFSVCPIHC
jgi:hypothetical protein